MASLVVSALSTWSNKGLKKAEKDVSAFDKTVKNLGKTFAGVFAASTIINYSKNAVKAFMDDEKAAKALEVQLNNLGLGFAAPGVELYISNLQRMTGVLDDELRPAFQTLVTATGDLTTSQNALDLALNISAGTGKSLESVSAALAKGFLGQTTALSRLGAGLDKTLLATGDMNKIMAELNKKFSGQATARLSTYAGQMSLLQVYAADAQETIGKGLLDAIKILGRDTSIQSVGDSMQNLADNIANVTTNLAKMIKTFTDVASNPAFQAVVALLLLRSGRVDILAKGFAGAAIGGILTAPKQNLSMEENRALAQKRIQDRIKEAKGIKTAVGYRTQENAALKAKTELDKTKDKFDLERIGLMAALNAATDEETKLRLKAQLAILDNNSSLAAKYNAELEAAQKAKELAAALGNASNSIVLSAKDLAAYLASMRTVSVMPGGYTVGGARAFTNEEAANQADIIGRNVISKMERMEMGFASSSTSSRSATPEVTVNLNAAGSILGLEQVDAAIQDALLRIYRQNGDLAPAGTIL
jgi:hypothetical protein